MVMIERYNSPSAGIYIDKNLSDIVKVLACIIVALHHYSAYVISLGYSNNIILKAFSSQGGYLGVALFFFMSGFGLMMSENKHHLGCVAFLKKRLSKILVPSIFVTIIWMPVYCNFDNGGGNLLNINVLTREIWHWGDDVMWFIKTLTLQYIFFYVYAYTRQRFERHKTLILVMLTIGSFFISYMVELRHAISLPLFYMGVWIADHPQKTRQICCRFIIPCFLIFSLLVVCYMGRHNPMILHIFFNYIVVIMSITVLSLLKVSITNLPSVIGQSSFDVYLVHNKVLMSMRYLWGVFPLWSFIIASFIATVIFGYFRFTMSKVLR